MMPIDEIIKDIKTNIIPFEYRESLYETLNILRKYQKIEQIVKTWNDMNSFDSMTQISEVMEDANGD